MFVSVCLYVSLCDTWCAVFRVFWGRFQENGKKQRFRRYVRHIPYISIIIITYQQRDNTQQCHPPGWDTLPS